jgi:hypothetical protein
MGSAEVIKTLLPGINQVIPAAPIKTGQPGIVAETALTNEQRDKINLLRGLVAVEEEKPRGKRPSAIDFTLEDRNFDDMAGPDLGLDAAAPAEVALAPVAVKRGVRLKVDRLLISLFVAAAVILPFVVSETRIGSLPPAQFAAGSRQQAAYDRVNALRSGQLVLVAAEYGPTGAAELDSALDALLRHIVMRGARPVVVSGNAVGLLHAQDLMNSIAQDSAFLAGIKRNALTANRDYYIARYLVGESIGLRDFGQNLGSLIVSDVNGAATGLTASSLRDFALVVLVAERAEDVRAWGEQIAPLAAQPLVIATGYSAAPLAEPYSFADSPGAMGGVGGMLVGYMDAYTYREMLDTALFGPRATAVPPTAAPVTVESPVEATSEATVPAAPSEAATLAPTTEGATLAPTAQSQSVEGTPTETQATFAPTEAQATLAPTEAPTINVTLSPVPPTAQPTSPGITVEAVIRSSQAVNVREGPGTSFAPVTSAKPGATVQVIGRSGDGQWIQIRTSDGTEGWVSAQLVAIQEPTVEPTPTREGANRIDPNAVLALDSDMLFFIQQAEATPEATVEATSEVTPESTPEVAPSPSPIVRVAADIPADRDNRWYSMTFGLMAIIVVIALAALVNVLRGLVRRGNK